MATLERGQMFAPEVVEDLLNKVAGKSSIAKLANQMPLAFNGNDIFTFAMDNEVDIVAESGAKSHGGVTVEPVHVVPLKIEYGARVSDEFIYGAEEKKLDILKAFNDGFAKKAARGLDIMAMHGLNPRTNTASTIIGTNHFDNGVTAITWDATDPDGNIEDAIAAVADYANVNGIAMAKAMSSALAQLTVNGVKQYPQLAWGANPGIINGCPVDVNSTVSVVATGGTADKAILGDFEYFRWGIAKQIPLEVIEYGNPDNDATAGDLKGHNQVYLRCELYIGWAILDKAAFAVVR